MSDGILPPTRNELIDRKTGLLTRDWFIYFEKSGIIVNQFNNTIVLTVGAAGTAAALPATPEGYLPIRIRGIDYKIPLYLPS